MTCCNAEPLPIFAFENADGSIEPAQEIGGFIVFPNPIDETVFEGVPGDGIDILPGGSDGHAPTFSVCVDPLSPLTFANGKLSFDGSALGSPDWVSANEANPVGGIRVITGGTQGHGPTFNIAIGPGEPFQIVNGLLTFTGPTTQNPAFSCADLGACSVSALGDVTFPNGCNDGDVFTFNNGVWSCAPPTAPPPVTPVDVHAELAGLPSLPTGVVAVNTVVIGDDGNCYLAPPP